MKRLPARKEGDTWLISSQDLKSYNKIRYCMQKSIREGELIFDKNKGHYSVAEVAKILRKDINQVYYLFIVKFFVALHFKPKTNLIMTSTSFISLK